MRQSLSIKVLLALAAISALSACTHRVEVSAKEPITINLNVKVELGMVRKLGFFYELY